MSEDKTTKPQYHSYHELRVWQKTVELCQQVYALVEADPPISRLIKDRLLLTTLNIPSSIANGHASRSKKEYVAGLKESLRQLSLVETLVLTPGNEGILQQSFSDSLSDIRKMLAALTSSLTKPKTDLTHKQAGSSEAETD